MLTASHLKKSYGQVTALDGFDLEVAPGEIVGLIGHNGAGKSTFVSIVTGLARAGSGTVTIDGRPSTECKRLIGVAPQTLGLYPTATVREHLRLFARLYKYTLKNLDETASELMLEDVLDRQVRELSGGQQRRVQAATALVHRPAVLLLDEPTVGADPVTRDALLAAVRKHADRGAAVVYTTHYLPELDGLDATLAVAREGRVVARGSRQDLLAGLPGSVAATYPDGHERTISTSDPGAALAKLLTADEGLPERVDLRSPSLDDLYRSLHEATLEGRAA
jgi:ABC-2 type transport system ATP-binding protein